MTMTPDQRKRAAMELRANPLLPEILETMQNNAVRAWRSSPDPQQREMQWHQDRAITQLRSNINAICNSAARDGAQSATAGE